MNMYYAIVMMLLLTGCDAVTDCIIDDGPEFDIQEIPPAILNEVFDVTITASINNNPYDDSFNYDISFDGALPDGLLIIRDDNQRTIKISGTPIETGSYNFSLKVDVVDPDAIANNNDFDILSDPSDLCYDTRTNTYTLIVNVI